MEEMFTKVKLLGVKDNYIIGNRGTVINTKTGKKLKGSINQDGYMTVSLGFSTGPKRKLLVHRLVAIHFVEEKRIDQEHVNHKDGIKLNNDHTNLEWCTPKENTIHAINLGLITFESIRGENKAGSIFTDAQVEEICRMFQEGKTYKEVCLALEIPYQSNIKSLSNIRRGKSWRHIRSKYNIETKAMNSVYDVNVIETICDLISNGFGNVYIAKEIGYKTKNEKQKLVGIINQIRHKKVHVKISSKYF